MSVLQVEFLDPSGAPLVDQEVIDAIKERLD